MNPRSSSTENLDKLDQSFMYTELVKETFFDIDHFDSEAMKQLVNYRH